MWAPEMNIAQSSSPEALGIRQISHLLVMMMLIMMMDARWRSATIRDFVRFRFPVICENVLTIFPEAVLDSLMERQQIWRHSLAVYLDAFSQNRNLHRDLIF